MNLNFVIFYSELEKSKANGLNGQKANLEDDETDSDEVDFTCLLINSANFNIL